VPAPSPPLADLPSASVKPPAIAEAASPPAAPTSAMEIPMAPDLTTAPIARVAPPLAKPQNSSLAGRRLCARRRQLRTPQDGAASRLATLPSSRRPNQGERNRSRQSWCRLRQKR
jgi:hypothetical protein